MTARPLTVVTGGGRGIGAAISRRLVADGHDVVVADRQDADAARSLVDDLGAYVHYAAAKAGVEAFTIGLSKEVAADGIQVSAVAPGTIWTDLHQDPQRPAKVAASIPMGRGPTRRGRRRRRLAAVPGCLLHDRRDPQGLRRPLRRQTRRRE